ncbi:MAG: ATP-binding cassette domain-containing protein [Terriglobales bacterium]
MPADTAVRDRSSGPLLCVEGLTRSYVQRRGWLGVGAAVVAVDGVDLAVERGATWGIVGQSGAGKSTLARCIACLDAPTAGRLSFDGRDLLSANKAELFALRRQIQLIFQDSATALNPHFTAREIVAEPLLIQKIGDRGERNRRAVELMEQVGLSPDMAGRRPAQFSGGQRQRLAIARALALRPSLLVLDEALTGLDLPVQAQILRLLAALKTEYSLTYLFVSHDLALMAGIADHIAVMHAGKIVESGRAAEVVTKPQHAYTQSMLRAIASHAATAEAGR